MNTPDPADPRLVARLVGWARRLAAPAACGPVAVLAHRSDELVVRTGEVVVKARAPGVRPGEVRGRLALAERLAAVMLTPTAGAVVGGRTVTLWPAGTALREADLPDVDGAAVGALLATLHRVPAPDGLPECGAPARVERARRRLLAGPAGHGRRVAAVTDAFATLPSRLSRDDDLGLGDPAWDLARPAAWFAAGVLDPAGWGALVAGYRGGGGPAIPPDGDPWPVLEPFARALTAQIAALAVVNRDLDVAETYVACCRRIAAMRAAGAPGE